MTNWKANKDTALLIIDPQNGFCPGGNLAVNEGDQIMPVINGLRPHFSTIVMSQDWHPEGHVSFALSHEGKAPLETIALPYGTQVLWPDHCMQNTKDADFHPALKNARTDLVLRKGTNPKIDSYSAFFENDQQTRPVFDNGQTLTERLQELGIKKLVLAGLAFDYCVGWSALDAIKEGFDVTVVFDATRGIAPESIDAMKQQLNAAGAKVVQSRELAGLFNGSTRPNFDIPTL